MNYSAPPAFAPSSSSSSNSASPSPSLLPISMVASPGRVSPALSSGSSQGTPSRRTSSLPQRSSSGGKGGCWTCRLRRKKCDEERDGDSCRTCKRLTIECLGWGAKRPDWMRDKQAVETYKGEIKAKLTRAGLIRGQPRTSLMAVRGSTTRSSSYSRLSATRPKSPSKSHSADSNTLGLDINLASFNYSFDQSNLNGLGGLTNGYQLPGASYSDSNLDFGGSMFSYSPQSSSVTSEPILDFDMGLFASTHNPDTFDFTIRPPSPINHLPLLAGQNSIQESHVMYFFENVRKSTFRLGGHALTNVTYSLIVQDPRGAVTNAVCAISSLHFTRMRVSQGLEAPDPNPEHSTAQFFHDEAFFQLSSAKQTKGCHDDSDVLAAIYLICYGQLAGNSADYHALLTIALDWMAQTGLTTDENPKLSLLNMSPSRQLAVKLTMWAEVFSSFSASRPPKYLTLYRRLLEDEDVFWGMDNGMVSGLQMDTLTGCPDEVLLCIAEVSTLAHWKTTEQRKGSLSIRELLRRADEIEQRLRSRKPHPRQGEVQLHPSLTHTMMVDGIVMPQFPSEETSRLVGTIYRETALLYLHTTTNDMHPGIPEIATGVNNVVRLLQKLVPSELDRSLMLPICLAGCMSDDSAQRDLLKARLQSQDENIGNLLRTRLLMEAVWQKRDTRGGAIDWRETLRERCPNLLLV